MIMVYEIGFVMLILAAIVFRNYQKDEQKQLDKNYRLMAGISIYIADRFFRKYVNANNELTKKFKLLKVKQDVNNYKKYYLAEKIAIALMVIGMSLFLGIGICVSESEGNEKIKWLERDDVSENSYDLIIEGDEYKNVTVDVAKRKLTKKQAKRILKDSKQKIIKKALGKNKNKNHIDHKMNLIDKYGDYGISIAWEISDEDVISYEGIIGSDIKDEGVEIVLRAYMELEHVNEELSFSVIVFPSKDSDSIEQQLQSYIDKKYKYEKKIKLPERLNGKKVNYYSSKDSFRYYCLPLGVILAILIFFSKDKELDGQIKKRNEQLLADYSEIAGKIMLYFGAGLSLKSTMEKIVEGYEQTKTDETRYAYEELALALAKIKSGVSENQAINEYGINCKNHSYMKLANIIDQNIRRGANELTVLLKAEVNEALIEKKNSALKEGSKLSTKLLGPMIIMLIISMVIIMVPAFLSIEM